MYFFYLFSLTLTLPQVQTCRRSSWWSIWRSWRCPCPDDAVWCRGRWSWLQEVKVCFSVCSTADGGRWLPRMLTERASGGCSAQREYSFTTFVENTCRQFKGTAHPKNQKHILFTVETKKEMLLYFTVFQTLPSIFTIFERLQTSFRPISLKFCNSHQNI